MADSPGLITMLMAPSRRRRENEAVERLSGVEDPSQLRPALADIAQQRGPSGRMTDAERSVRLGMLQKILEQEQAVAQQAMQERQAEALATWFTARGQAIPPEVVGALPSAAVTDMVQQVTQQQTTLSPDEQAKAERVRAGLMPRATAARSGSDNTLAIHKLIAQLEQTAASTFDKAAKTRINQRIAKLEALLSQQGGGSGQPGQPGQPGAQLPFSLQGGGPADPFASMGELGVNPLIPPDRPVRTGPTRQPASAPTPQPAAQPQQPGQPGQGVDDATFLQLLERAKTDPSVADEIVVDNMSTEQIEALLQAIYGEKE